MKGLIGSNLESVGYYKKAFNYLSNKRSKDIVIIIKHEKTNIADSIIIEYINSHGLEAFVKNEFHPYEKMDFYKAYASSLRPS